MATLLFCAGLNAVASMARGYGLPRRLWSGLAQRLKRKERITSEEKERGDQSSWADSAGARWGEEGGPCQSKGGSARELGEGTETETAIESGRSIRCRWMSASEKDGCRQSG
eukprot:3165584-Rhodomonas_salina.1